MGVVPLTVSQPVLPSAAATTHGTRRALRTSACQTSHFGGCRPQNRDVSRSRAERHAQRVARAGERADQGVVQPQHHSGRCSGPSPSWDVVGLGQAMVDLSATVEDKFLVQLGVEKGSRRYLHETILRFNLAGLAVPSLHSLLTAYLTRICGVQSDICTAAGRRIAGTGWYSISGKSACRWPCQ